MIENIKEREQELKDFLLDIKNQPVIDGEVYLTYQILKGLFDGLTTQRLLLWREGKGRAKKEQFRFIKLNDKNIYYCLSDIQRFLENEPSR